MTLQTSFSGPSDSAGHNLHWASFTPSFTVCAWLERALDL